MALLTGYVWKIGVVGTTEPAGRITLTDDFANASANVNCATGQKFEMAKIAFTNGNQVEIDVLNSTNPFVADKIRVI